MWFTYSCLNAFIIITFISSYCNASDKAAKATEAVGIAQTMAITIFQMFLSCVDSVMPNQQFLMDNIQSFINYPSKTTVGFAPKYTSNRKFFANMISTQEFKDMLANDEDELRRDLIKKLRYCDEAVMDKELLKDFYDREVDQTKI